MGKLSRRKGARFEREIARRFAEAAGTAVERELTEVRAGNIGDLSSDLPCAFQLKCGKAPSVWRALREAQEAAEGTGRFAVAVLRRSGTNQHDPAEDIVAMPLEDFEELLSQLRASGAW